MWLWGISWTFHLLGGTGDSISASLKYGSITFSWVQLKVFLHRVSHSFLFRTCSPLWLYLSTWIIFTAVKRLCYARVYKPTTWEIQIIFLNRKVVLLHELDGRTHFYVPHLKLCLAVVSVASQESNRQQTWPSAWKYWNAQVLPKSEMVLKIFKQFQLQFWMDFKSSISQLLMIEVQTDTAASGHQRLLCPDRIAGKSCNWNSKESIIRRH